MTTTTPAEATAVEAPRANFFDKLYTGDGGIDFIGRRKIWYAIAVGLLLISIASMTFRGFDLSVDFEGGTRVSMPAGDLVAEEVDETFTEATGVEPENVQIVGAGDSQTLEIASAALSEQQSQDARLAIAEEHGGDELGVNEVGVSQVSESWGSTITERMIISMVVFLVLAGLYVAIRLQRQMALAALLALAVDGIVIAGIYSIFSLEVSPAVVIGLLTVLTFSIYDTVIVFDKVKENSNGILESRRATYEEQANLAVNQTLMRSLSTSIISALPIIALFVVAVWMLGIGTLRDLAVIQLIGVIEGLLSSLFLATPILVELVNRKQKYRDHNKRVADFRARGGGQVLEGAEGQDSAEETAFHDSGDDEQPQKRTVVTPDSLGGTGATWRPNRS